MSVDDERTPDESSPHCRALESRIAELEGQLAAARAGRRRRADGDADRRRGLGRGLGAAPFPRASALDGRVRTYAYQCLPMVMANQWGWQVLCPTDVRVTWDGSPDRQGVCVEVDPKYAAAIKSQFGSGIVTFSPPGCSGPRPAGTCTPRGRATAGRPTARPWRG